MVVAVANMQERRERAIEVLRSLLGEDVAAHAIAALGELGATEGCAQIEPILEHEDSWVREEAKKALRKLDCRRAPRGLSRPCEDPARSEIESKGRRTRWPGSS